MNIFKGILVLVIRIYQIVLSPMKTRPSCKYYPTCSQYAIDAIKKYGAIKGGFMAAKRLLRCNPFSHGGYDPVK